MTARPLTATTFLEQAAAAAPPPVVVLAGAEPWFRTECVRRIAERAGDATLVRIDAKTDEGPVGRALDEVGTAGLFGGKKVVVVENPEAVDAGQRGKDKTDSLVLMAKAAASGAAGATLVLSTSRGVKGKSSVDAEALAAAGALLIDCRALYDAPGPWDTTSPPWDHELARFVSRRMKVRFGKRLGQQEAHALCQRVGNDIGALEGALETLALSVGDRTQVTGDDVAGSVGTTREDPGFALADAVLDGDLDRALDLAAAVFDRGIRDQKGHLNWRHEALFAILTVQLHGAFRKVLAVAEALARGDDPEAAARAAGVPPFVMGRFVERSRRRDAADLLARHAAFLEAETGVKGGGVPPRLAFERLVVALAGPAPVPLGA